MANSPTTLIRPWKGFANLRVYPAELRRDLEELDSFIKDIRQAVGKMVGEVSITNTTITNVTSSTIIFADYGLDGGGALTGDVHLSVDPELVATGSEAWTGSHAWEPSANSEPVTISKTATLLSADLVRILDVDDTPLFVIDNIGLVGINCEPDAMLTIQGATALSPPGSPTAWYKADSITAPQVVGGLVTGGLVAAWTDSSGNGHHLTGRGCIDAGTDTPANRPQYNLATTSKAIPTLPSVSFDGSDIAPGVISYFTFNLALPTFPASAGYTIAFIWRDYSAAIGSPSIVFGSDQPAGGDTHDFIREDHSPTTAVWIEGAGGGDKYFSTIYSHTSGAETEAIALRVTAGTLPSTNTMRAWVDGVLQPIVALTYRPDDPAAYEIRYIGRHINTGGAIGKTYNKALVEVLIYNSELTDAEVDTVNAYLLARIAGAAAGTTYDLTRWEDSASAVLSRIDATGRFGFGVAPSNPIHVNFAGTQMRLGVDVSNYYTTTVSATGIVTFDAFGVGQSFVFADPVNVTGNIVATGTVFGTNLDGTTNTIPKWANGAAAIFGDSNITDTGTVITLPASGSSITLDSNITAVSNTGPTVGGATFLLEDGTFGGNAALIAGSAVSGVTPGANVTIASGGGSGGAEAGSITLTTPDLDPASIKIFGLGGGIVFESPGGSYKFHENSGLIFTGQLAFGPLSLDRVYTFPDASGTVALTSGFPVGANPTALVGNVAVNGTATTFMRSDGAPALDLTLARNWSAGVHTFAVKDFHLAGLSVGTTGIDGIIESARDDGATAVAWNLTDTTTRTTGFARKMSQGGGTLIESVSWDGRFSFGIGAVPQAGHVLAFVINDALTPAGVPHNVGIGAVVSHSSATQTLARGYGIAGAYHLSDATTVTAKFIAGIHGSLSSEVNSANMTGRIAAAVSGCFARTSTSTVLEPLYPDQLLPMGATNFGSNYDHIAVFFGHLYGEAASLTIPGNKPVRVSTNRIPIQTYPYSHTVGSPLGENWGAYGEAPTTGHSEAGVAGTAIITHYPAITGFMRVPYPRFTAGTGVRAMQLAWEPWPNTTTIRAGGAVGDTYFDDGTNFQSGLWQRDAAGYVKLLNDDLVFYDNEIVAYDDESVGYH